MDINIASGNKITKAYPDIVELNVCTHEQPPDQTLKNLDINPDIYEISGF